MNISIETELVVSEENRPGMLAELSATLSEADVNILGLSCPPSLEWGRVFLYLDKLEEGRKKLEKDGYSISDREVIVLRGSDQPGILGKVAQPISEQNINIDYAYAAVGGEEATVVLQTKDNEQALQLIKETLDFV